MIDRSRRKHRQLPRSFKVERREHWLDRHEREVEDHEEALRELGAPSTDGDAEWST